MLREHARIIMDAALAAARPEAAVRSALEQASFPGGRLVLVSVGKAAWQMAQAAALQLGDRIQGGVVITKYGHSQGPIPGLHIFEAGHPVPDANSFLATEAAISAVSGLSSQDTMLFLLSGGASALFEKPLIPPEDLAALTEQLLACGAEIREINTLRKRFSAVKGGRFAKLAAPARMVSVVLSDVLGDRLDMIGSGPACADLSTCEEAQAIVKKYGISCTAQMEALLEEETPKSLPQVTTYLTGSVGVLCHAAEEACRRLGYTPLVLTDRLSCTARDAGVFLGNMAGYHAGKHLAIIAGGETVVKVTGTGKGGRNQELALAAAQGLSGLNACLFSLGSDGTDGPTDAAGGYVDGSSWGKLRSLGMDPFAVLEENNSYPALRAIDGLIFTGPTGTNVNDLTVLLLP